MNEIVLTGNIGNAITKLKAYLAHIFLLVGSKEGITMSQRKYALELSSDVGLAGSKSQ